MDLNRISRLNNGPQENILKLQQELDQKRASMSKSHKSQILSQIPHPQPPQDSNPKTSIHQSTLNAARASISRASLSFQLPNGAEAGDLVIENERLKTTI